MGLQKSVKPRRIGADKALTSNRVFEDYGAIINAACTAWQDLIAEPATITSIGSRKWAHVDQN